jgi:hypothetical protein
MTVDGRRVHEFRCTASNCKGRGRIPRVVRRYLDTSDRNSTGNLRKHARQCWGDEILRGADACGDLDTTREGLEKAQKKSDGSLTVAFGWKGEGRVTYSHRQHTRSQTRFVPIDLVIVLWSPSLSSCTRALHSSLVRERSANTCCLSAARASCLSGVSLFVLERREPLCA